ncbi:MAG: hypothetical protein ACYCW6_10345 [Candidatus Xenobia bacterium]
MKRIALALLCLMLSMGAVKADPTLPSGPIELNGKVITSHYLQQQNDWYFPVRGMAEALHHVAVIDKDGHVTWDGKKTKVQAQLLEGDYYVGWDGLSTLVPNLQFDSRGDTAIFTTGGTAAGQ